MATGNLDHHRPWSERLGDQPPLVGLGGAPAPLGAGDQLDPPLCHAACRTLASLLAAAKPAAGP
jgi:hypothetical protein